MKQTTMHQTIITLLTLLLAPLALQAAEPVAQEPEIHRQYSHYHAYEFFVLRQLGLWQEPPSRAGRSLRSPGRGFARLVAPAALLDHASWLLGYAARLLAPADGVTKSEKIAIR
jgi:hypothetical protein